MGRGGGGHGPRAVVQWIRSGKKSGDISCVRDAHHHSFIRRACGKVEFLIFLKGCVPHAFHHRRSSAPDTLLTAFLHHHPLDFVAASGSNAPALQRCLDELPRGGMPVCFKKIGPLLWSHTMNESKCLYRSWASASISPSFSPPLPGPLYLLKGGRLSARSLSLSRLLLCVVLAGCVE